MSQLLQGAGPGIDRLTYSAAVLADSPVGYWRLASATATVGPNGTVNGTVTFGQAGATSDGDTAALFDNATGYIDLTDLSAAEDKDFTYECWFKDAGVATDKWMVAEGRVASANPTVGLIYQAGQVRGWFRNDAGTNINILSPLTTYGDGNYHHAALTGDGTTLRLYVDGSEVINGAIPSGVITLDTTTLGASKRNTVVSFYDGTLDEAAIYGTALAPARILAHFNAR